MIKVYLDWNVMVQLKNGSQKELREALSNRDEFLVPFSTAHIGDIFASFEGSQSQQEYIDSDLEFISELTEERCLFIQGEKVVIDYFPPKELFEQRVDSGQLLAKLSTRGISALFERHDIPQEALNSYNDALKSLPMPILNETLTDKELNERAEKLFPSLKENPTLDDMLNGVIKMIDGLNETESYKELRKTVQSGFNIERNKIFDSSNPFEIINSEYKKAGVEKPDQLRNSKQGPRWYNEICDEYLQLDMHGYQEDKINAKKGRKETFKNTTEDSFHCAFATTCNFYVTSDKRTYKKTKKVYERLGLNTVVLKPAEFIEYFREYLDFKDDTQNFAIVDKILQTSGFYEGDMTDSKLRTYFMNYFLFDFFNKIMVIVTDKNEIESIILGRNNPSHDFTIAIEIRKLITRLDMSFGIDVENIGDLKQDEFSGPEWKERVWNKGNLKLTLRRLNGHFQLYLNLLDDNLRRENGLFKTRIRKNIILRSIYYLRSVILRGWSRIFNSQPKP